MALVLGAAVAGGCGADEEPAAPAATEAPAPSLERVPPDTTHPVLQNPAAADVGPGLDELSAPSRVACREGAAAEVPVSWSAPAATEVRFVVDGEPIAAEQPPVGSTVLDLPCDGSVHVVVAAAVGDGPDASVGSVAVLTEPGG